MSSLSTIDIGFAKNIFPKVDSTLYLDNDIYNNELLDRSITSIFSRIGPIDDDTDVDNKRLSSKKVKMSPKLLGKPKRALSAYNLFFQSERAKILNSKSQPSYKPRRSHGKIGFAALARSVADKWKKLDPKERAKFEAEAAAEKERYEEEVETWNQMRLAKLTAKSRDKSIAKEERGNATIEPISLKDENNFSFSRGNNNMINDDMEVFKVHSDSHHQYNSNENLPREMNLLEETYAKTFLKLANLYHDTNNTQSNIISILDCNPLNLAGTIPTLTFNDFVSNCDNECLDILSSLKALR